MWDYKRTESNKRLYNVFLRYENETGDLFTEYLGDEWAHSDKQAARYMSYKHGDNGNREVSYKGYTCRYYAKVVEI